MSRRTIEQERARSAWQAIERVQKRNEFEKYKQLLQGLPVAIHTAGLGQTVAFYRAKGKEEHKLALEHLAAWLLREQPENKRTDKDLVQAIQEGSADDYRRLTAEALAYLAWLKRFAAAAVPVDATSSASP